MTINKLWRITFDTNPEDCNLNCIMCEEHSPYSNFKNELYARLGVRRRVMPFEWIENIMHEANQLGVQEIIPSTMGEPLIYKHIEDIIALCHEYGIKMNLTTNGTFSRKSVEDWARLIIPITSDVKFSWNGATAETAEKIMHGIDFEQNLHNCKKFICMRDEHHAKSGHYCRVTMQLTFMQNNMHELADMVKLAASLGVDRVKGHHLWVHFAETKHLSMRHDIPTWNRYVTEARHAQETYRKPNGEMVMLENIFSLSEMESSHVPDDYECPFLERELWISAEGKISPCCAPDNLRQALGDFGNIQNTTLHDVLQSDMYQNLVKNYKSIPLCLSCNMRKPVRSLSCTGKKFN
ncbi:MAG: radical SAM protein [Anaerolineaceae bacterium 4572_78]|nr:MAG: radical SAM protein [Anaerolineaceae bacterium 4572_78]